MAVSPEDLAAGALALQVFVKNAKNVEIIVNVAFATIPTILGLGAAGLIGSGIINTAREVRNSISLLKTVGPMAQLGWMASAKVLTKVRTAIAERLQQSDSERIRRIGDTLASKRSTKSRLENNQDSQGTQQSSGGSGGSPPTPPDIRSTQDKQKGQGGEGRKIILPEDLLKSGKLSPEDYLKLQKKLEK